MKRWLPLFLLNFLLVYSSYSQTAVYKHWDARFGGNNQDEMQVIRQTKDGGYILGGYTESDISGNITEASRGNDDYWVVKIDAGGNYQWDKRLGGLGLDGLRSICVAKDGGYIIGGFTGSDNTGDISQPSWGGFDYWIVKLDSLGNKLWDKRYGGSDDDFLTSVNQTKDGGYILGGNSSSDSSGDKTQASRGGSDYWMVKIDSAGNKQWDKRFGTSYEDGCNEVITTPDGGYLLGGTSQGVDTGGDKTQPNNSIVNNFWIVKADSSGNKQWDKVFGGDLGEDFGNAVIAADGNYILGGQSYDGVSGDKTAPICGYWLVKIDTLGNKLGDWAYGSGLGTGSGSCVEGFGSVSNTSDRGYILTGISGSDTSGDQTSAALGQVNVWTIKIDSQMHRVWDRASFTLGMQDASAGVLENTSGCYVVGVQTNAGIGGDKSQPDWGYFDYWVVEYCDTPALGIQEPEGNMHLTMYPNPTSSDIDINIQKDGLREASFTLTNIEGKTIYQSNDDQLAHSYTKIFGLSALPCGIYLLTVTVDGERIVKQVIKE